MKLMRFKKPNKNDMKRFMWCLKFKNKDSFFGTYSYNRCTARVRPISESLIKYYGMVVHHSKDEAYKLYYSEVRKNKPMQNWEVKKIKVSTIYKLTNMGLFPK